MSKQNYTNESVSAESDDGQTNSGINPIGSGDEIMGALECEYPNGRGLYGEVFARYDGEVADALIDTQAVRMLVEIEYNLRRTEALLIACEGVPGERVESVEECRICVESELWAVCEALVETCREKWYSTGGEAEWAELGDYLG